MSNSNYLDGASQTEKTTETAKEAAKVLKSPKWAKIVIENAFIFFITFLVIKINAFIQI